jgi:hypothetical protein
MSGAQVLKVTPLLVALVLEPKEDVPCTVV